MDESVSLGILAVLIMAVLLPDAGFWWLGVVALVPLASKVPDPL